MDQKKTAVILFNLGGPDSLEAVKPFLFNLFYDPAIIRLSNPFRWAIAKLISSRREKTAQGIYERLGGKSPLLSYTQEQAWALEKKLGKNFRVFPVMRYWHPRAKDVVREVLSYNPDQIVLLPLYPQYSTTTTDSSFREWHLISQEMGLEAPTVEICCYPQHETFVQAHVDLLKKELEGKEDKKNRILFSAHGLPQKIVEQGDPYAFQIKETAEAIMKHFPMENDWRICYQSRVGPTKWLEPSTEAELKQAAEDNTGVIIVPIAFVSEHSETLVELDYEYKELAHKWGIRDYHRVPALNRHALYIQALAELTQSAINGTHFKKTCPSCFIRCRNRQNVLAA